jgi:hypothetical protein
VAATRADAARLREIFVDESVPLREQRRKASAVLVETAQRYRSFNEHVVATAARLGTTLVMPADAGTVKKSR